MEERPKLVLAEAPAAATGRAKIIPNRTYERSLGEQMEAKRPVKVGECSL